MTEEPTPEMIEKWHRRFAVECNNHTWDLIDKAERTPDEDQEMLNTAYASIYHWSKVGTRLHIARGEVNLAHVHALRGEGEMARRYARSCLAFFESGAGEDWVERVRRDDPFPGMRPQPEDMLEDATLGGARAVRQPRVGALEVGRKADLLVLDTQRIHLVPAVGIVSAWIHNGQPADIESVMVDGQFVMRDRKILTADEAAIIAEADAVGRRVWGEVQKATPIVVPGRPR